MVPARALFRAAVDVRRVIGALRAVRTRGRPRPVVRVVQPAVRRIEQVWRFVGRHQGFPFGRRVGAVDRLRPVEAAVALRDEVGMEVTDVAVGVRVDRIVRRVRMQFHRVAKLFVVARLRTRVRLNERVHRVLHQPDAHPSAVLLADDGAVVGEICREFFLAHAGGGFVRDGDVLDGDRPIFVAVAVDEPALLASHGLEVLVDVVDAARRVHPAGAVVEALVDEELAPRDRAICVQPLLARHLRLGAEKERRVRVDQQERVTAGRIRGCDRDAVRAGRLDVDPAVIARIGVRAGGF